LASQIQSILLSQKVNVKKKFDHQICEFGRVSQT
jgi:hypothetical protein